MDPSILMSPPLVVGSVVLLVTYIVLRHRRPANYPPGPPMLPVIGSVPFLKSSDPLETFTDLMEKYGPVFSFAVGSNTAVVLANYESIMEACVKKGREFGGRMKPYKTIAQTNYETGHRGILDADYSEEWKAERHTAVSVLRSLGYGKNIIQVKILEEFDHLAGGMKEHNGKTVSVAEDINSAVANIISSLLFGERYDYDNQDYQQLRHVMDELFALHMEYTSADYIPILRILPGHKEFMKTIRGAYKKLEFLLDQKIKEQKENEVPAEDSFIGMYLRETKQEGRQKDLWLMSHLQDFFAAGMETTTTTLGWGMYYMAKYPEVQARVQQELDSLGIKDGGHITQGDKSSLPYTEATMFELLRMANTAPLTPHHTLCDTSVAGYNVPINTDVVMFIGAVHRDPKLWPEPEEFRPERFLDSDGQVVRREQLIPFGAGKRACLGEQLARQELFLFFTNILNTFQINESDKAKLPPPIGTLAITYQPPKFEVLVQNRH